MTAENPLPINPFCHYHFAILKRYDACGALDTSKYPPWPPHWPRCPSGNGTHAIMYPFVLLNVQCLQSRQVWRTINASQLFFEYRIPCVYIHIFDPFCIFKLRIHACNKNKITTFYRWQWKYLTAVLLSKFVPYRRSHYFMNNLD